MGIKQISFNLIKLINDLIKQVGFDLIIIFKGQNPVLLNF